MLAKMGYKAGEGIGKGGRGRAAPIAVDLKAGRTGLGVDEERKRKQQGYRQLQDIRSAACMPLLLCIDFACHVGVVMDVEFGVQTALEMGLMLCADSKRLKGQEIMQDSYLTHQATFFAEKQAEQGLQEAQRVSCYLTEYHNTCAVSAEH